MREVFKCLGIRLDEDCFTVIDKDIANVKNEHCVDDDMLWEDQLEDKSVLMNDEFTSILPLTIDLGESSVSNALVQKEDLQEGQSLLVSIEHLVFPKVSG